MNVSAIIKQEIDRPVDPAAQALALAAREKIGGVKAVLFYGSCLRNGVDRESIADLYLLTEDYRSTGMSWLAARGNRALPPNVFYLEAESPIGIVRAKVAIVALAHFEQLCGPETFHSYFWARFAQPTALAWAADDDARAAVVRALARAVKTFARETATEKPASAEAFWVEGFQRTYASELRAEGPERAKHIYGADRARYEALFSALTFETGGSPKRVANRWRQRRSLGKFLSVARLFKAAFTFEGGVDYILWKIERHSGVRIVRKPWERRWPWLAVPGLAFRAWRQGGFK